MLTDEKDDDALAVARTIADEGAVAPFIWRYEVLNALLTACRRGRINEDDLARTLDDVAGLEIELMPPAQAFGAEIVLARRFALSIYDAAYLELAFRKNLPLITRDQKLAAAAKELGLLWRPQT